MSMSQEWVCKKLKKMTSLLENKALMNQRQQHTHINIHVDTFVLSSASALWISFYFGSLS